MRNKIFTSCLLLMLPFLLSANQIEGKFTTTDNHVRVKIKDYKHGLKIKGLVNRRYVKFRYVRPNTYADYYGNMVKVVGPHKLVFRSNNWSDKFSLYRLGYVPKVKYKRKNRNNNEWDYDRSNDRGKYDDRRNNNARNRSFNGDLGQLEGTWESKRPDKEVVILETRNGIKVKFRGSNKWTRFDTISHDNQILRDKKDNEYSIVNEDEIVWRDRKGDKVVRLRKISDEVRY